MDSLRKLCISEADLGIEESFTTTALMCDFGDVHDDS